MTVSRAGRGADWFEFYPVEEELGVQLSDKLLLVDIGGGVGHDLVALKDRLPNLRGKLVLENLPTTDAGVSLPGGIEAVGPSFFDPQPPTIKNAKAYYLRTILHNCPDSESRKILEHICDIMFKDSVLLIN